MTFLERLFPTRLTRVSVTPTEPPKLTVKAWEPWDGPLGQLPRTTADVYRVYGNPGVGKIDPKWERANMVLAKELPGIPKGRLYVHKLVEPYVREALRRCSISCPEYTIYSIGCFSFRHMRHDPSRPLSRHSWGIAVDINPKDNRSAYFKAGETPEMWSDAWNEKWPKGMPREFVQAWQSVGWANGADWNEDGTSTDHTYVDLMHMECVDRARKPKP